MPDFGDVPWHQLTTYETRPWTICADECLRQMAWVYSEGWNDNSGDPHDNPDSFSYPTTIAPKNWKPE
jgi:hypothetical protein